MAFLVLDGPGRFGTPGVRDDRPVPVGVRAQEPRPTPEWFTPHLEASAGVEEDVRQSAAVVERATVRLDVAKTVNADTGVQVWFGLQHPF